MSKKYSLFLAVALFLATGSCYSQISPGSFKIFWAGTQGEHRGTLGYGTVTVNQRGIIKGTIYNYDEEQGLSISGSVNRNGIGVVSDTFHSYDIRIKSRQSVVVTGTYFKQGSDGASGLIGGIR